MKKLFLSLPFLALVGCESKPAADATCPCGVVKCDDCKNDQCCCNVGPRCAIVRPDNNGVK